MPTMGPERRHAPAQPEFALLCTAHSSSAAPATTGSAPAPPGIRQKRHRTCGHDEQDHSHSGQPAREPPAMRRVTGCDFNCCGESSQNRAGHLVERCLRSDPHQNSARTNDSHADHCCKNRLAQPQPFAISAARSGSPARRDRTAPRRRATTDAGGGSAGRRRNSRTPIDEHEVGQETGRAAEHSVAPQPVQARRQRQQPARATARRSPPAPRDRPARSAAPQAQSRTPR